MTAVSATERTPDAPPPSVLGASPGGEERRDVRKQNNEKEMNKRRREERGVMERTADTKEEDGEGRRRGKQERLIQENEKRGT